MNFSPSWGVSISMTCTTLDNGAWDFSNLYGLFPVASSYIINPKLQMSQLGPYVLLLILYGLMYISVPTKVWAIPSVLSKNLLTPKSASLTYPFEFRSTFSGLISRWIRFLDLCMYSSPLVIWVDVFLTWMAIQASTDSGILKVPLLTKPAIGLKDPRSINSITWLILPCS